MTCRHTKGDPACGSNRSYSYEPPAPLTPDKNNFTIEEVEEVTGSLVLKVKYPNCRTCAYEGTKVLVFCGATIKDAIKWREIDPHFRKPGPASPRAAPSPDARFPASDQGWRDALAWARNKRSEYVK